MVAVGYDKSVAIDFRVLKSESDDTTTKPPAGAASARAQASTVGHGTAARKQNATTGEYWVQASA